MYAIQCMDNGRYTGYYVAPVGKGTWVKDRRDARQFETIEAAQQNCCENEKPVKLSIGWV